MSAKLLTIIVPTYNRAAKLEVLLDGLETELAGCVDRVDVIIADNASHDNTPQIMARFQERLPAAVLIRRPENLGAEESYLRCAESVTSRFFWIIGDDDAPKPGTLRSVLDILDQENPDLVYLASEWVASIDNFRQGGPVEKLEYALVGHEDFSRQVHVWMTFISGMIVNRNSMLSSTTFDEVRQLHGTSLMQLGWILSILGKGRKFAVVKTRCILATSGNSGGYAVMKVFGEDFPRIVEEAFAEEPTIARAIISRTIVSFLTGLTWKLRFSTIGNFDKEYSKDGVTRRLRGYPLFWATLFPVMHLPKVLCLPFLALSRGLALAIRLHDRL